MSSIYPTRFTGPLLRGSDWNVKWDWISGSSISSAVYIIFSGSGGGLFEARNGYTGLIEFSGSNFSTIINSAITALGATGGKIYIRKGAYNLSSPINIGNGSIHICGEGDGTQLNLNNLTNGIVVTGSSVFGANGPNQTTISDLTISSVLPARGNRGIYILNSFEVVVRNVRAFYMSGSGIRIEDSAGLFLSDLYMEGMTGNGFTFYGCRNILANRLFSDTNNIGFEFANSPAGNGNIKNSFSNCYSTINNKGYSVFGTNDSSFNGCIADGSNNDGFQVSDSARLDFNNCLSIGNSLNGMSIIPTVNNMTDCGINIIGGEYIDNKTGSGIALFAQNGLPISRFNITNVKCFNNGINVSNTYDGIRFSSDNMANSIINSGSIIGCVCINRSGSTATQRYGINLAFGTTYIHVDHCIVNPNLTGGIAIDVTSTGSNIKNTQGFNPQGAASIAVTTSPFTYTNNDNVSEAVYIIGGTINQVAKDGNNLWTTTNVTVLLEPTEKVTVTYSSSPTMIKDRK